MPYTPTTGDRLLAAWLSLTSTLWNKRLVSTLTYNEAHVLGILLRAEDTARVCTATTLIAQTRLLKSQMNKLLTTLEGKGFIRRARSEEDKRVILIRLTDAGRAAYLAEHEHIPHQIKRGVTGSNDASAYQRAAAGCLTCVLSVPCRYIHSGASVAYLEDIQSQYELVRAFLMHA